MIQLYRRNFNFAKSAKLRRNSLLTIWWKTNLAFSGLTHVVLTVQAFWQGPYFWFLGYDVVCNRPARHLEEITWKYRSRGTSFCFLDSSRIIVFSHQLWKKLSLPLTQISELFSISKRSFLDGIHDCKLNISQHP